MRVFVKKAEEFQFFIMAKEKKVIKMFDLVSFGKSNEQFSAPVKTDS